MATRAQSFSAVGSSVRAPVFRCEIRVASSWIVVNTTPSSGPCSANCRVPAAERLIHAALLERLRVHASRHREEVADHDRVTALLGRPPPDPLAPRLLVTERPPQGQVVVGKVVLREQVHLERRLRHVRQARVRRLPRLLDEVAPLLVGHVVVRHPRDGGGHVPVEGLLDRGHQLVQDLFIGGASGLGHGFRSSRNLGGAARCVQRFTGLRPVPRLQRWRGRPRDDGTSRRKAYLFATRGGPSSGGGSDAKHEGCEGATDEDRRRGKWDRGPGRGLGALAPPRRDRVRGRRRTWAVTRTRSRSTTARARSPSTPASSSTTRRTTRTWSDCSARSASSTESSDMSFAVSKDRGTFEYQARALGIVAQPSNLTAPCLPTDGPRDRPLHPRRRRHSSAPTAGESTGDWLDRRGYSRALREDFVLPMMACIWSSSLDDMASYPAATMAGFLEQPRPARRAAAARRGARFRAAAGSTCAGSPPR